LYQKGRQLTQHVVRIAAMTQGIRSTERVRLLDFGCGWGEFLSVAQSFGFEAFGIERAPDRMDHLRRRGIVVDEDLESVRKKTQGSFHAVTLFQVLEHLDNPLDLLKSLYPIMAPGAVLVLEVPNCEGVSGIRTLQDYYAIHPLEHFNCFTPKTLASIAQRAGFAPAHIDATHVTTSIKQVIKSQAKTLLERFRPRSTNQYFRKA
ncbi:MAG: class I SAM-dependent methyltransferase, partial [Pirellula sp.]